jgi:hypothetical protein
MHHAGHRVCERDLHGVWYTLMKDVHKREGARPQPTAHTEPVRSNMRRGRAAALSPTISVNNIWPLAPTWSKLIGSLHSVVMSSPRSATVPPHSDPILNTGRAGLVEHPATHRPCS